MEKRAYAPSGGSCAGSSSWRGYPAAAEFPKSCIQGSLVYIDAAASAVLAQDAYDRHDELFKSFANWLAYRDRPVPDARVAIYPLKRLFEVPETTTDVQSRLAETRFLPLPDAKEKELGISTGSIQQGYVHTPCSG